MKQVFCIGELLIDFVAENQGSDLSKAHIFTKKAGGAPANVACAIAKLGGNSNFIGSVGDDAFGDFLLDVLDGHKVNISLAQRSNVFTTLAFVSLAEDGERDFVFSRGADRTLSYNERVSALFQDQVVHFGAATCFLGGPLEATYIRYLEDAKNADAFVSFDPNFRADLWKENTEHFIERSRQFIARADLCKFSKEEAQLLAGKDDLENALATLHELGTPLITITLGKEGTLVSLKGDSFVVPSVPVHAVDTTGAGDAFIGCLLYQLSCEKEPHDILVNSTGLTAMVSVANKAGAITTTNFGAIDSLPALQDLSTV